MTICTFLRFTENKTVEKVTWTKAADGTKTCIVAPHYPTMDELISMKKDKHQELLLPK